jgi:hypothetical protein
MSQTIAAPIPARCGLREDARPRGPMHSAPAPINVRCSARVRYPVMAASNASASGLIVRFAFVCGRPGTCAASTQLLLLTSIAVQNGRSWPILLKNSLVETVKAH